MNKLDLISIKIKTQIKYLNNFNDLVSIPFQGDVNAMCWQRNLKGNFLEIVNKLESNQNIRLVEIEDLLELDLSEEGQWAREILINDFNLLKDFGAQPNLNIIKYYEKDESFPLFPTDVYSYHVDRSPIPTSTFLCTYYGTSSDILPNEQAEQKILIPEIRNELKKLHTGTEQEFDSFLTEHFFDLHYRAKPNAQTINLGIGNLWRLAVDHPESKVLPCVHRAPIERPGESRLLMIC